MKRMGLAGVMVVAVFLTMASASLAAGGIKVCTPKKEGNAIVTPKHGKCKKGYKLTGLGVEGKSGAAGKAGPEGKQGPEGRAGPAGIAGLTNGELETLRSILPHMQYVASGVGGKPTVQFSGVDVQLLNGEGKTGTTNGEGNLVIGYDETAGHAQTGSHNLVLGEQQTFTSYGGLVAGSNNTISAPGASVTGGHENTASGTDASIGGGIGNGATGFISSVSSGFLSLASGTYSSVSGGALNKATGQNAWLGGGYSNTAPFLYSSIFGGKELETKANYEAIP
jgi:hypothetical protein